MSPAEAADAVRARLASELDDDLTTLERIASDVDRLRGPTEDERTEWMRSLALAFAIERYYTALETTLVRVLRSLDGDVPSGERWHQDVLRAAGAEVAGLRPRLLTPETVGELRELLKFRHLARHGYDTDPELARMESHASRVAAAHLGALDSLRGLQASLRSASLRST